MEQTQQVTGASHRICSCSICGAMLYSNDNIADLDVYKLGELDYILLAHVDCAKQDDAEFGRNIWRYD